MYVTTYNNKEMGDNEAFIRLNRTHHGATQEALTDAKAALGEYENQNGEQVIQCSGGEDYTDEPSIIRIINPKNGYEYETYIIEEHIVND